MKKTTWVKSLAVTVAVTAIMGLAGFYFFAEPNVTPLNAGSVEATGYDSASVSFTSIVESIPELRNTIAEETDPSVKNTIAEETDTSVDTTAATTDTSVDNIAATTDKNEETPVRAIPAAEASEPAEVEAVKATAVAVEEKTEEPAAAPVPEEDTAVTTSSPSAVSVTPVTYSWGSAGNYTFLMEVKVTNTGTETSKGVAVSVPLLENSSPYQTTTLKSVNYDVISNSGRVSTFNLGDLAPGESKTIVVDFAINVRTVSINSTNDTVEQARKIYEKYAGSGNCRELALGFIKEARAQGIKAREVIGFARPQRSAMTSGSLQGARHSWAEFYIDGLGWVPVDLTFQYFGSFPQTSHIVESYSDQSIKVNFTGGSLSATWSNAIL